ncbi:hypothetical protein I4990_03260 [Providencia alcalifaciens]|nr:hypothetical protein [Providencia alcalifaciens]
MEGFIMRSKLIHQWKFKRRARLSFLGAEILWSVVLGIIQALVYQWYLSTHPEDASLVFQSNFYHQFSFSQFGLMEVLFAIIQIYIFTLLLTQRVRDMGIKYPFIISLVFTSASLFLAPLSMFNSSTFSVVFMFILLIGALIALFAPSAPETNVNIKNDVVN